MCFQIKHVVQGSIKQVSELGEFVNYKLYTVFPLQPVSHEIHYIL